jgi:hypothetical protein
VPGVRAVYALPNLRGVAHETFRAFAIAVVLVCDRSGAILFRYVISVSQAGRPDGSQLGLAPA